MKSLEKWGQLTLASCLLALVGCGVTDMADESTEDETVIGGAELSVWQDTFVVLQPDPRACPPPHCGGYFVRDVNKFGGTAHYVSGLDFTQSGLSADEQKKVLDAPADELILKGRLGAKPPAPSARKFVVKEAYRGLPGVKAQGVTRVYSVKSSGIVCIQEPCPYYNVTLVNHAGARTATGLDVTPATQQKFVQQSWAEARIVEGRALVAGDIIAGRLEPGGQPLTLRAQQIFLRLPEVAGPCPMMELLCAPGLWNTYERGADRCIVPVGCAQPGICPPFIPSCDAGYKLVTWNADLGGGVCPDYACDPEWVSN